MARPPAMPEFTASADRVHAFGEELLTASAIFDDLGSFTRGRATSSGLRGTAAAAYDRTRALIGSAADAASLAMRAISGQVFDHAAELARLSVDRAALVAQYDDLVRLALPGASGGTGAGADPSALDAYEADRLRWIRRLEATESATLEAFGRMLTLRRAERRYGDTADPADGVLDTMPAVGASPAATRLWWASLTPAQREGLIAADPASIGNRDGVPAWARDRANTVRLDRDLQELGQLPPGTLTPEQRTRLANATAADRARTRMRSVVDPLTGRHYPTQLYLYDPDAFGGDGAVAIGLGDLDTARNVAVTVPGFGTDAGSAEAQATKAIDVQQAADFLGHGQPTATMFWIGYDVPDNLPWTERGLDGLGVLTEQMARAGGHHLATTIDGIVQMRRHDPHLTVIGHSYGSTTAGLGASYARPGELDDLVLVGSPGAGQEIRHASDTGVGDGHVWDGRNSGDPIARLGNHGWFNLQSALGAGLGTDPASDDFGARRFEAESTLPDVGVADHLRYFDHDTESLANMAHIVDGDYGSVAVAPPVHDPLVPDPQRHLGAIVADAGRLLHDATDAGQHPTHAVPDGVDAMLRGQSLFADLSGGPEDPEATRTPTAPDTDGR